MRKAVTTVGVVVLLVLAGCGGSTGGGTDTRTGGDAEPTPTTTPTRTPPEDGRPGQFTGPGDAVENAVANLSVEREAFLGTWGRNATAAVLAAPPDRSRLLMGALPALSGDDAAAPEELSTDRLRELSRPGAGPRYVLLTDRTLGEYVPRIAESVSGPPFFEEGTRTVGDRTTTVSVPTDRLRNSTAYGLYHRDASGLSQFRLVRERQQYSIVGGYVEAGRVTSRFSVRPDDARFRNGWNRYLGNLSAQLSFADREKRAVGLGGDTYVYDGHVESTLKVFERVPGATVTGRIENVSDTTVVVTVELETGTGRTFDYVRETRVGEDGRFEVTVPYSTTGSASPEGTVDSSVRATGDYEVLAGVAGSAVEDPSFDVPEDDFSAGTFGVSERQVYDGATIELGTLPEPPALREGSEDGESDG